MRHIVLADLLMLVSIAVNTQSSAGSDFRWNDAGGGLFAETGNWTPTGIPGALDSAVFDITATYPVAFDRDVTISNLTVERGSPTFDLNGHRVDVTSLSFPTVLVGGTGTALLRLEGEGELISNKGYLGDGPDGIGIAEVEGTGTRWLMQDALFVGNDHDGNGHLKVLAGGAIGPVMDSPFGIVVGHISPGTALIDGAGSLVYGRGVNVGNFATGELTISNAGEVNLDDHVIVGRMSSGSLEVLSGGKLSTRHISMGEFASATADVLVQGSASRATANLITIGGSGPADLEVRDGGGISARPDAPLEIYVADLAPSSLLVDGPGSFVNADLLRIGISATGSMTVSNGAIVTTTKPEIGWNTGVVGKVAVTGQGSTWHTENLLWSIGDSGHGEITVADEGLLTGSGIITGYHPGSSGTLRIESGGKVDIDQFGVGYETETTGIVEVLGPGSLFCSDDGMAVGYKGNGFLAISEGAHAETALLAVAIRTGSSGTVVVSDFGQLHITDALNPWAVATPGSLHVGGVEATNSLAGQQPAYSGDDGLVEVKSEGTLQVDHQIVVWQEGMLRFVDGGRVIVGHGATPSASGQMRVHADGLVTGNGSIEGDVISSGIVRPGNPMGDLYVDGQYIQLSSGILEIGIDQDMGETQFGELNVAGAAVLDGILRVRTGEEFLAEVGTTFRVLVADIRIGRFATIEGNSVEGGLAFRPYYGSTDVLLELVLRGDANGDRQVGTGDYAVWAASFGQTGENLAADFNFDGMVGTADYALWASNFGMSAIGGAGSDRFGMQAPEPSSLALAGLGALGCLVGCRRRRRAL